jgi:Predicted Fe-S protein
MDTLDTRNPCIKVCRFDAAGQCIACLRTRAEAKQWKRLPDATKAAINERLRAQGGVVKLKTGKKKAAKRLKKLDRKIRKLEAKLDALRAERSGLAGRPLLDAAE